MSKALLNRIEKLEECVKPPKPIKIILPLWLRQMQSGTYKYANTQEEETQGPITQEPVVFCECGSVLQTLYTTTGKEIRQCQNRSCLLLR
jgi:hypothetical protein